MPEAFRIYATIELDAKDFRKELGLLKTEAVSAVDKQSIAKPFSDADKQVKSLGGSMKSVLGFAGGQMLSNFVQKAVSELRSFSTESLELASSMTEVQNVIDVTFGDDADQIDTWARVAKSSFGISELGAKRYTGVMGSMLKSMGLTREEAVGMSTDLAGLAGDMASFYNLDIDTAFEKLRSGISGETEPLKQLGINMSVVNLEAYAMSRGIDKSYQSMTQAEQALLRYNYLMEVTADAQGDFSRTSDSYANAMRLFQANLDAVKADFGSGLRDVIEDALNVANSWFKEYETRKREQEVVDTYESALAEAEKSYGAASYILDTLDEMEQEQGEAAKATDEYKASVRALAGVMPELAGSIDASTGSLKTNKKELTEIMGVYRELAIFDATNAAAEDYGAMEEQAATEAATLRQKIVEQQGYLEALRRQRDPIVQEIAASTGWSSSVIESAFDQGSDSRLRDLEAVYFNAGKIAQASDLSAQMAEHSENIKQYTEALARAEEKESEYASKRESFTQSAQEALEASPDAKALRDYEEALTAEENALSLLTEKAGELKTAYEEIKKAARETVNGVVSGFKEMDLKTAVSFADLKRNILSQTDYLTSYNQTYQALMGSGVSADFLAQFADYSEDNAAVLRGLQMEASSGTSWTDIAAEINTLWGEREVAAQAAAEKSATATAAVDEDFQALLGSYNELAAEFDISDEARAAMERNVNVMDEALRERGEALVSTWQGLKEQLEGMPVELKVQLPSLSGLQLPETSASNAKGLDYVPYNDYLTYVHKGEAILDSVDAEQWRAGQAASQGAWIDYDRLGEAVAVALSGSVVQMDSEAVGELVAPAVNRSIQRDAWAERYGQ